MTATSPLLGRVVQGIRNLLSLLSRAARPQWAFTKNRSKCCHIKSIRVAADVAESERSHLELLRTDTKTFRDLIESRRNRHEPWFQYQAGRIEIGNVPLPVRRSKTAASNL